MAHIWITGLPSSLQDRYAYLAHELAELGHELHISYDIGTPESKPSATSPMTGQLEATLPS